MNKWIDVKDKKPDYCTDVAVLAEWYTGQGELSEELQQATGYISYRGRWLLNVPDTVEVKKEQLETFTTIAGFHVRYWYPLPSPPNQVKT